MSVDGIKMECGRLETPPGNKAMSSSSQDEDHLCSNVDAPYSQRREEIKLCHPLCRTPRVLTCFIISLVGVISITAVSALITLSLTLKDENSTMVSHPLFEGCTSYPSYSQVYQTLEKLHIEFDQIIKLETIGESFEKRNLTIARLSSNFEEEKPKVWIQCGAHGRETTTPITCLLFIYNLAAQIADKSTNGSIGRTTQQSTKRTCIFETESWKFPENYQVLPQFLVDREKFGQYEFIILPLVNPDGYQFALHQPTTKSQNNQYNKESDGEPFWRKNRNNSTNNHCRGMFEQIGVDLNRNYDIAFHTDLDQRKYPCSNGYGGEKPFSESETRAISKTLGRYKGAISAALDIHSFMPGWLYPTLYKLTHTNHSITTQKIVSRISSLTGAQYEAGSGPNLTYLCSGTFMDWAYEVLGCHHSYTVEIRSPMGSYINYKSLVRSVNILDQLELDTWRYFQPEFIYIQQVADEAWVGLLALLDQL